MAMRALYEAIIAVAVLTVAASGQALAAGKGGGGGGGGHVSGDGPKGNVSLNYGKFNNTYTQQKPDGSLSAKQTGKAHFNEFTIKRNSDKASPN
jgi:type VI protein secretion system component Hcp